MEKKQFAVFGIGRFGRSVATTLAEAGYDVLAVDKDQKYVEMVEDIVTKAVVADVTDKEIMESLSVSNIDTAFVGIGSNLEASILITILAKECGVKNLICKASTELHGQILKKVGADRIVYPEMETGERLAKSLIFGNDTEFFNLSDTYSMVEIPMPGPWVGKSLKDLHLRSRFMINAVGFLEKNHCDFSIDPEAPLQADSTIVLVGANTDLQKLRKALEKNG
ncbi:MAG: TrkA family potassium uptake protein [Lachnospiraceae bacterium]|nr:TrkA family potassium uptake protein [Lachnospiraceae bacterium]